MDNERISYLKRNNSGLKIKHQTHLKLTIRIGKMIYVGFFFVEFQIKKIQYIRCIIKTYLKSRLIYHTSKGQHLGFITF